MTKLEQKLREFLNKEGNLTTDVDSETDFVTPKRISKAAPQCDLSDIFAKLVSIHSETKKKIDNFEAKMLNQFDNVTSRINALENVVRNLKSGDNIDSGNTSKTILKNNPAWSNITDFNEICDKCINDSDFEKQLIKEINSIGGTTAQNCTSNIVARCISSSLLNQFSLKGQAKDKANFSSTKFYQMLLGRYLHLDIKQNI